MSSSVFLNQKSKISELEKEVDELKNAREADKKKLEQLEKKLDEQKKLLEQLVARSNDQETGQLAVPEGGGPSQPIQLSPNLQRKVRSLNFEPIGGQRVRCTQCNYSIEYKSNRVAQHKCNE